MQLVVFKVAGSSYAFPVESVREVLPYQRPRALPTTEPWDLGVVSVRGSIMRVWDLAARLGLETDSAAGGFVVVDAAAPVACVVERVIGVRDVTGDVQPLPYVLDALGMVAGDADELLVVLDADRLFGTAQPEGDGLDALSKRELDRQAREAGIDGRSRMGRDQLIAALRAATRS